MNAPSPDGPPAESPLDLERVEWLPATPTTVTVLVVGRWRGDPPRHGTILIVEDGERRHFPADRYGEIEGVWTASFTIPNELRPDIERRLGLLVDGTELKLPGASAGPADETSAPPPATVVDQTVLDELRAKRVEGADESLVRRAQAAEATAATLRTQLENLEQALRTAVGERDELSRELRAVEQREEAERRVRQEAVEERDGAREETERRVGALRAQLRAAELHATELAREMDAVRREGSEAQQEAVAARRAAERAEAEAKEREAELSEKLRELGGEAGDVAQQLAGERGAREEAERALAAERDRVASLQAELQQRAGAAGTVRSQLEALRADLDRVREEAQGGAALRERIAELERDERALREELERRAGDLEQARVALEAARGELVAARDAEAVRAAALREAERSAEEVQREAAELRRRVEQERRRRFEVEAELRAELEREREELGGRLAAAEGTLRSQLAAERRAFAEQTEAIERTARQLREKLAGAAAELQARLEAERTGREAAEAEAAELRVELDAARAREGEVGELVGDLLATSTSLREGFERELRSLEQELRSRMGTERDSLRERLTAMEHHVDELRDELERERAARLAAESELAAERGQRPPAAASEGGLAELEKAKDRLSAAEEQLERVRAREDLHAQARAMIRNLEDAERRLRTERESVEEERPEPEVAPEPEPEVPAIESASGAVEPEAFEAPPEPDPEPEPVAEEPPPPPPAPEAERVPPPPPVAPDDPEAYALHRAAEELASAQREAAERAAARRAARRAAAAAAQQPQGVEVLRPRVVDLQRRNPTPWLATAVQRVAISEPRAAARLLTALLPAQGPAVDQDLVYELAIDGDGAFRVELEAGVARVEPLPPAMPPDPSVEVRVAGPPAVLAPLVAGGAARRLTGARVSGKRRRLRRLLRARRAPVTLADLAVLPEPPEPAAVLRALAAAIEPEWTAGHSFTVVYEVTGATPATHHLVASDGAPLKAGTGPLSGAAPAATVTVARAALLPLLSRTPLPPGERALLHGDASAVALVHRWTDRVQGIPTDD